MSRTYQNKLANGLAITVALIFILISGVGFSQQRLFQIESGIHMGFLISGVELECRYTPAERFGVGLSSALVYSPFRIMSYANTNYGLLYYYFNPEKPKPYKRKYLVLGAGFIAVKGEGVNPNGSGQDVIQQNFISDTYTFGIGTKRRRLNSGFSFSFYRNLTVSLAFHLTWNWLNPEAMAINTSKEK
jgi:hypothetical protein